MRALIPIERYGLSSLFLYMAWLEWGKIDGSWEGLKHPLILGFQLTIGISLLTTHPVKRPPQSLKEVLVPLGGTFLYLTYGVTKYLAPWMTAPWPHSEAVTAIAYLVAVAGHGMALWAALSLGRSFGVFVSVRKVVMCGAYKYVRHPMYVGHFLQILGITLAWFSPFYVFMASVYAFFLVWRARLEERALARVSPAYDWYMDRVPAFLP